MVRFNPSEDGNENLLFCIHPYLLSNCCLFFVDTQAKKRMVRDLKPQIGENLFDGAMLFTLKWLPDPCVHTVKNEVSS